MPTRFEPHCHLYRELSQAILVATRYWSLVDRRELLTTSGLAMADWTTPIRRWLTTPADPLAAHTGTMLRVGAADVAELLSAAEDARRWDSRYGGGNWRSSAILNCLRERAAPLLHGRYTDHIGRQLFTAGVAPSGARAGKPHFVIASQARARSCPLSPLAAAGPAGWPGPMPALHSPASSL